MLQRFDAQFLRDFRHPAAMQSAVLESVKQEVPAPPAPPPAPTFSEEQLAKAEMAAKEQGYVEGFEAGLKQAQTETAKREQEMAASLAAIAQQFQRLSIYYQEYLNQKNQEISELTLLIARKVAEDALDANSSEVIAKLVQQCLPLFLERPKITVELHSALLPMAESAIQQLLAQHGYEGDVYYRSNDSLQKHAAKLDWGAGQAHRSPEALWQEIEALVYHNKPNT